MTLQEERAKIYSALAREIQSMKDELNGYSSRIQATMDSVKANDTGDARENAGLDIAKENLAELYQEVMRIQGFLSQVQEVEESELFSLLFPEKSVPEFCRPYNHIGRAVLYSTLRLSIKRGYGGTQDMIILLMPSGFNFKTPGCASIDADAVKLMINAKAGQVIPYTCATGEKVEYTIVEIY